MLCSNQMEWTELCNFFVDMTFNIDNQTQKYLFKRFKIWTEKKTHLCARVVEKS